MIKNERIHRWALRVGILLLLVGIGCFIAKAVTPSYLDAEGILHEAFFLLPLGYAGLLASAISFLVAGLARGRRQHA
ncbi:MULTISPECIES: DUF3955 domain-containing protein [unclassified Lacticaseibacillus]|uniref:DUF3955 domain-containing protein n=1 Tax=unclassified Lacticaseibacillus TaxID=2759744 RepID=UPI001944B0AC|nr:MULTISPECIES: DUF3955 domain-containing protein [unclassified Lacticaseibacillus]